MKKKVVAKKKADPTKPLPKNGVVGMKKKTDNSTSYNKKDVYHSSSAKAPDYPYGQPHNRTVVKKKK